jgi:hypothetical protein
MYCESTLALGLTLSELGCAPSLAGIFQNIICSCWCHQRAQLYRIIVFHSQNRSYSTLGAPIIQPSLQATSLINTMVSSTTSLVNEEGLNTSDFPLGNGAPRTEGMEVVTRLVHELFAD